MSVAFKFAVSNAIATRTDYPYKGRKQTCKSTPVKVQPKSYAKVKAKDAEQLKAALVNGPVSVSIEADKSVF